MTLFSILRNASSKTKSKMAAYTPEILTFQPCIQRICLIPTAIPMFSMAKNSMKLFLHCVMQAKSEIQDGGSHSTFRLHHT